MAKVLFISTKDLKRGTILNGNIDDDKLLQFIDIAQEIHIQSYLGTKLFNKLRDDIAGATLTTDYRDLLDDYIKPMVVHWTMAELMPLASYEMDNGGVFKHTSETSETLSKNELEYITEKYRSTAQHFTRRFIDYICNNSTKFPEYNQNSNSDVYPNKKANSGGWVL